jgi:4-hydroxy-tetrahydrodipicolinate reductase
VASHALVIFGITGRMGQSLVRAVREGSEIHLTGAVASSRSERLGLDAATDGPPSGVLITADSALALRHASVAVDFSLQDSVLEHAQACAAARVPLLVGATGLGAESRAGLKAAAHEIPVLIAPNTSVGIALLRKLVAAATQGFGAACEVEISEAHHRLKRDAPSGTALSLGELVAETRGEPDASGIRYSVVRAGEIVGEHTVSFGAPGERLEITHRATDRMIFARGALRAAAWLVGRAPGLYGMQDVLGV